MYIWQQNNFPNFVWDSQQVLQRLSEVKYCAGKLSGIMGTLGFEYGLLQFWRESRPLPFSSIYYYCKNIKLSFKKNESQHNNFNLNINFLQKNHSYFLK